MNITHYREQHAVGQGSFHSASVEVEIGKDQYRYDFVYDCGTLTSHKALRKSIDRLDLAPRQDSGDQNVIDMLVLSHYDYDHINGAEILSNEFKVRRIVVPHLSPSELMLVLASQPGMLSENQISELHSLANNRTNGNLFGIPVTQVLPSPSDGSTNDPEEIFPDQPNWTDPDAPGFTEAEEENPNRPICSMQAVEGNSNKPIGSTLPATGVVHVSIPGKPLRAWRLKFWNRGTSDHLTQRLTYELCYIGFPMRALRSIDGAPVLTKWLMQAQNRKDTLDAYKRAIARYKPNWEKEAAGRKLANFLSLCMYSGPAFRVNKHRSYFANTSSMCHRIWPPRLYRCACWHGDRRYGLGMRTGWLGTGDAPLGEPNIWADFNAFYQKELQYVLTVQVPHHGAAPKSGPKFFNPSLLPDCCMFAVVSAGYKNPYGHPRTQVIKEVLSNHAYLEIVTEERVLGFQEFFNFDL